jgi:hypothetical protein
MARIRSVKPSLRTSRVVAQWKFEVRYFWVLLWGYLDDKGRGLDIPKSIAGDCFPLDDKITAGVIDRWLYLMATTKIDPDRDPPVCRYEVAGTRYLHCVYWDDSQRPNRPSPSRLPPCPVHESFTEPESEPLTESFTEPPHVGIRNLTEGEFGGPAGEPLSEPPAASGLGPEPPRKCPKHQNHPHPPDCGGCGAARRANEDWQAKRRANARSAPKCPRHRGELASNCGPCAAEAKGAA